MNRLLSSQSLSAETGIALFRIIIGLFIAYHGLEVFNPAKMKEYAGWSVFNNSALMPYLGKGAELVAGVMLALGLLTRIAAIIIIGTFLYITFFIGKGKFWMEDQHPFLFALAGMLFLFTGPGPLSVDKVLFKKQNI